MLPVSNMGSYGILIRKFKIRFSKTKSKLLNKDLTYDHDYFNSIFKLVIFWNKNKENVSRECHGVLK